MRYDWGGGKSPTLATNFSEGYASCLKANLGTTLVEDSDFDTAWKQALEWFFEPFLQFFFPSIQGAIDWSREPVFLDKELQQIVPEAETGRGTVDKLVKVWTAEGIEAWVLVHVEVQSQHDAAFAERMYVYNHRLRDTYGRMPVSLAVLGDESRSWRPSVHAEGRWGCEVRFTFPTVKLVDYSGRDAVLEAAANPFAAVTLAHLKANETRGDAVARYDWKMRLVKGLYDRGFTTTKMKRLFNVIEWVIKLPPVQKVLFQRELDAFEKEKKVELLSETFQLCRDEGLAEGRAEGRTLGQTEGQRMGLQRAIELGLKRRFGEPGLDLLPRIKAVTDIAALENLIDTVQTASDLAALAASLPVQPTA